MTVRKPTSPPILSCPALSCRHHSGSQATSRLDRAQSGCSGAAGSCSTAAAPAGQASGTDEEDCPICTREQQQLKDALVSSKLDAITLEYNYLLTTQLDSQRQYFEGMLAQQDNRHQQQLAAAKAAAEQQAAAREAAAAAAKENEKKRQQLERKLVRVARPCSTCCCYCKCSADASSMTNCTHWYSHGYLL